MFIDEVKLKIKGGNGGNGIVSYKNAMMEKGPTGGDGGRGGDVYLQGVSDLSALRRFRHEKKFSAGRGGDGSNRNKDGANGEDLVLKVPIGTIASNLDLNEEHEITKVNERVLIAHGANGGFGNFHFRSSTNITPRQSSPGHKAREFDFLFELKLIADAGFIGLPNAGKSALLNELTKARANVANYPFTTLEPNLGAYYGLILADIPGLIEGASVGRGLGHKFLRHISRCRVLFHLISAESEDIERDYRVIRAELERFDKALLEKPEFLFLSKTDLVSEAGKKTKLKSLKKLNPKVFSVSVYDYDSLTAVKKILDKIAKEKTA